MEQVNMMELRDTVRKKIFEMSNSLNDKYKPIYKGLSQLNIASKIASRCGLKKCTAIVQLSAALNGANYPRVLNEANQYLDKLQESYRLKCEKKST